jgi:enoyl-CoA hydratase/carnithine racemase
MSLNPEIREALKKAYANLPGTETNILTVIKNNQLWINFNRPKRYNAFTLDMYPKLAKIIREGNAND